MKLLPLYDRVIVRLAKAETKTESGLEVVRRKEEFPDQGVVVAVGSDAREVMVGDEVIFKAGIGTQIRHEGEKLIAIKIEDIEAVVAA